METKKNSKVDLEKSRSIFFLIGLLLALGLVLAAFNFSTVSSNIEILVDQRSEEFEEMEPPVTRPEEELKTPEPIKNEQVVEILEIVEDDEEIKDEHIPVNNDPDENTAIAFKPMELKGEKVEKIIIVNFAQKMPEFPGGEIGLRKYISTQVKYPQSMVEKGIGGKVYVRFCVTSKGIVKFVSIARGVDPVLDKEAMRVVKLLPKWKPGENGGRKVNVWYTVPIKFELK